MRLSILQIKEPLTLAPTLRDLQNSSYPTQAEFSNCFFIYFKFFQTLKGENEPFVFLFTKNNTTLSQGFLSQWFNNLQRAALLTSF